MATRKKPVLIADLVARLLASRHGHPSRSLEATTLKVFAAFARIGPPLTEHAEPQLFKSGVLQLVVAESTWLTELTFLKPQVLERLNKVVGAGVVRDLRMKLGRMTVKKKAPVKAAPVITEEQRKMIDAWGQEIASPELREALVRAAARSLEAKRTRKTVPYEGPPGPSYAGPEIIAPPPPPDPVDRWAIDRDRWRDREKK